jgi:hypothetical protein
MTCESFIQFHSITKANYKVSDNEGNILFMFSYGGKYAEIDWWGCPMAYGADIRITISILRY